MVYQLFLMFIKRAENANIGEVIVATEDQEIIDDVKKMVEMLF